MSNAFKNIRQHASAAYNKNSILKGAAAWHTWKNAFQAGYLQAIEDQKIKDNTYEEVNDKKEQP